MVVVLDSNIIRKDYRLTSPTSQVFLDGILRLGFRLCIPAVVVEEVCNLYAEDLSSKVEEARRKLAAVQRITREQLADPIPDFEEAERLVAGADDEWGTMITIGLKTGMRQGELLGLAWDDIDLARALMTVRRSLVRGKMGTPKSGKGREIPLSEQAVKR